MSNIVSSTFTAYPQKDGRNTVVELHTDLVGLVHQNVYLAGAGDNLNTNLAANAANIGNNLASQEVANNLAMVASLSMYATPTETYSTSPQNVAALVAVWQAMSQLAAIFTGEYLNSLSDAILQSVFVWTPTQEANIRATYLQPYATMAASIRAAQGVAAG